MSDLSPCIVEASAETFQKDVVERSATVPVVVDFWAEWCGPCRQLGPILETLAREYDGRFVLVKADTEQVPEIATAFGVRSIPAVFGVREGRIVDSFVGAQPETAIRAWLDRLLPSPLETVLAEARSLEANDPATAEARYRSALELAPDQPEAKIGLARVLLGQDRPDEARALVATLERRGYLEPEAEAVKAGLSLRGAGARDGNGVEAARAALAASPNDRARALALAEALAAAREYDEALALCLDLVERDRKGVGEAARKTMLAIFQVLGDAPIVGEYQRKLASALF